MPRYVIERLFDDVDDEVMDDFPRRSKELIERRFRDLRWEHSHVVVDGEGNAKSFCVYEAPSEEAIRGHARALGYHRILAIYQIGEDVRPEDIPAG